ncbi:MAG: DNA polymerase Y family protein [Actinobacteria bacterium]|nr:DNA polymerase Y family protein [Actinomycetota bacterium]
MGRTLCVWFPDWPLRRPDAPPGEPCQVVDDRNLVTAADVRAREAGVRPGMRRREAEALCPAAVTLAADPGAEAVAFEPVAAAVEAVVPRVEVAHPGLLFVPLEGALRYYGSEQAVVERAAAAVAAAASGEPGRIGVADGPFAARMAAADPPRVVADTAAFLASLDIGALGVDDVVDTFRWLGIGTLGDLRSLPRAAIASRFGPAGLQAHRVASGEDRSPQPRPVPVDTAAEERFEPPLTGLEQAAFAARAVAGRLMAALAPSGGIPHRVEVEAESAAGTVRTRTWRSADPFTETALADRIRWQLRAWVESGGVPGGLVRLRVAPADLSDRGRQLRLTEDAASGLEERRALARAQALLGPDAVLQARPQGGRLPGERVQWHRWEEPPGAPAHDPDAPWPGRLPAPSPALVPPDPPALEVEWDGGFPVRVRLGSRWEPVLSWAGPWRSIDRWWEGRHPVDRYQLVTSAGAFLCEVGPDGCTLAGVYD